MLSIFRKRNTLSEHKPLEKKEVTSQAEFMLNLPVEQKNRPITAKTWDEVDTNSDGEKNELIDPINHRLMLFPLRNSKDKHLPAIEMGSLYNWIQVRGGSTFHPYNPKLTLDLKRLEEYDLDVEAIKARDNYLRENGYGLGDFLNYRRLTLTEYQRLLKLAQSRKFQDKSALKKVEYSYLAIVTTASLGLYWSGPGTHNLFFSLNIDEVYPSFANDYRSLANYFIAVSMMDTFYAHWAWNRDQDAIFALLLYFWSSFCGHILLLWQEHLLINNYADLQPMHLPDIDLSYLTILPLIKLTIPWLQGMLIACGESALRKCSFFSRDVALLRDYAQREPLDMAPDSNSKKKFSEHCGLM